MSEWNPMRQAFDPPVTLADFLLARIAEDERRARSVRKMNNGIGGGPTMPPITHEGPHRRYIDLRVALYRRYLTDAEYAAMVEACSTPAEPDPRVLAECESKRRIVELHPIKTEPAHVWVDRPDGLRELAKSTDYRCGICDYVGAVGPDSWGATGCDTLRALALPYAQHPDYREEWRP